MNRQLVGLGLATVITVCASPVRAIALTGDALQQRARSITVLVDGLNPGSGVIVAHSAQGQRYWVLTAQHVVATEDEYWIVTPDGQNYPVNYSAVKMLPGVDLALIPFDSPLMYPVATLANYPQSQTFPAVVVSGLTGSPIHGRPIDHEFSVGQLLRRRYGMLYAQTPFARGYGLFYTSVTAQGMSGGPVLDTAGHVIGIHGRSEGAEYVSPANGDRVRLHWGFSSGVPLPRPAQLMALADREAYWRWQTAPPAPPTSRERASLEQLQQPATDQPTDALDWTNRGNQLYRVESFNAALLAFERALQQSPNFYPAWYGMGQTLMTQGKYAAALQAYNQTLTLAPDLSHVRRDRALVRVLMDQPQHAVDDFDHVIQQTPDDYVTWYLRGNLFWKHFDWYEAALGSYDRALTLAPGFAEVWIERGRVLHHLGYAAEAIASLQRATQLEPDLSTGWYWLSHIQAQGGHGAEAIRTIERAIAIDPQSIEYVVQYGQLLIETEQWDRARSILTPWVNHHPTRSDLQTLWQQLP